VSRSSLAVALLALAGALCGCASPRTPAQDLSVLTGWMTGTFDSTEQAAARPDDYRPIRLVMLPIWEDRSDGPWLYVEQAVVGAEDRPYRQRVYRLAIDGLEGLRSDVYELPESPAGFVAAWAQPGVWKTCEPADLVPREGCSIYLRRRGDGAFVGETRGTGCKSRLGDAAYATSEVVVTSSVLSSWDRGFSSDNEQVWGAERGPYRFRKSSSHAPTR